MIGVMTEVVKREDLFPLLLEADPTFEPIWRAFLNELEGDESELPRTIAIDAFARHLVGKLEAGDTSRFKEIVAVIEKLHFSTDSYVSN